MIQFGCAVSHPKDYSNTMVSIYTKVTVPHGLFIPPQPRTTILKHIKYRNIHDGGTQMLQGPKWLHTRESVEGLTGAYSAALQWTVWEPLIEYIKLFSYT